MVTEEEIELELEQLARRVIAETDRLSAEINAEVDRLWKQLDDQNQWFVSGPANLAGRSKDAGAERAPVGMAPGSSPTDAATSHATGQSLGNP